MSEKENSGVEEGGGEVEGGGEEEGSGEEEGGGAASFGGQANLEAELELGKEWGHAAVPTAVYGNNPVGRGTTAHAVWQNVKYLKMHTANGTTVDKKYTHVCVTRITAEQAGEDGEDEDDDGQWRFFCNKLLICQKGKTCYKTTMATAHIKRHGQQTEAGKALGKRAERDNAQKSAVMEAASAQQGQRSGAALSYSISREELCLGKMARW
jgi:hypothetical protein